MNTWGESWVLKAAAKVETIPDDPLWIEHPHVLLNAFKLDDELKNYKLVDTDGQAFADAALSEREDNRQLEANNFWLAPHFNKRLGHLGWGFGPSITALGLASAFDHDDSPVSVHRVSRKIRLAGASGGSAERWAIFFVYKRKKAATCAGPTRAAAGLVACRQVGISSLFL